MRNKVQHLNPLFIFVVGVFAFARYSESFAYSTTEWSLETKVQKSDVIVVGRVLNTEVHLVDLSAGNIKLKAEEHAATVAVTSILKGKPTKQIKIDYAGPMPEDHPDCCMVGNSYVFFLKRIRGDLYESINQRYGIYRISPDSELKMDNPQRQ